MQFSEVISNEWDGFFDRKNDFSFLKLKDLFDFLPTTLQNSLEKCKRVVGKMGVHFQALETD